MPSYRHLLVIVELRVKTTLLFNLLNFLFIVTECPSPSLFPTPSTKALEQSSSNSACPDCHCSPSIIATTDLATVQSSSSGSPKESVSISTIVVNQTVFVNETIVVKTTVVKEVPATVHVTTKTEYRTIVSSCNTLCSTGINLYFTVEVLKVIEFDSCPGKSKVLKSPGLMIFFRGNFLEKS